MNKCKRIIKIMFEFWKRAINIMNPSLIYQLEKCMSSLNNADDKFNF